MSFHANKAGKHARGVQVQATRFAGDVDFIADKNRWLDSG